MKEQTYASYMQDRYQLASEGLLTDFISRRNGDMYFGDRINLNELAYRYGTPLEVVYYPQITSQVQRMCSWAHHARWKTRYSGAFLYAYATKANFGAEVVQTALAAGAHYETSAAADVYIACHLWQQGILPSGRLVCCNGSKEPAYRDAILTLRKEGCVSVTPVVDDLDELEALQESALPLQFGVRERAVGNRDGMHPGNDRFGLTTEEMDVVVERLAQSKHQLVLYHAMVGSQIEDSAHFLAMLRDSIVSYCQLRQRVPTLRYFNFGGGMPTSGYRLNFDFDYYGFLAQLMEQVRDICMQYDVPMPDLIGEFGRYTVANHRLYLFEVGKVKSSPPNGPDWYLVNGSLLVSMPDMALVENQAFVVLPLQGWDAPMRSVRLAGRRTCDSDDVYPQPSQEPIVLPDIGKGLIVAVCGVGAYQQMLSGLGGVHHCLCPEPRRVEVREVAGRLVMSSMPEQDQWSMMQLLGYQQERALAQPLRMAS